MIARDIMTRGVRMIAGSDDIQSAARVMAEAGISALPVVDDRQRVVGILSEGDLVRRQELRTTKRRSWWLELVASPDSLAQEYVKSHSTKVHDVMTRPVVSITEQTPIAEIASILERHRIKRVPVVMDGTIVGIVSRADLVRTLAQQEKASNAQIDDATIRNTLQQRLQSQPWAPSSGVNFSISNGTVSLYGLVSSEEQHRALGVMAETIPGVRKVKNETAILPLAAMG